MKPGEEQSVKHKPSRQNAKSLLQIENLITPEGIFNLADACLDKFPTEFTEKSYPRLLHIDISTNTITKIPEAFFTYNRGIMTLSARNNKLTHLDSSIGNLGRLTQLNLDSNQLNYLPNSIGDLRALSTLTVSNNKLFCIPGSIGNLDKKLTVLHLCDNLIKYLPVELGQLVNLRELYLHVNRFPSFPCSLTNLKNLKEFSLEWFRYANPPLLRVLRDRIGEAIIESLRNLCRLLLDNKMHECALITFLENFSEENFDINHKDNLGRTPLHIAASEGDLGVIEGLVLMSPDLNVLDKDGCTPLSCALREDNLEISKVLLDKGAKVNEGGGVYSSPLHIAVIKMEIWLVRRLLEHGADTNACDQDKHTPLHILMSIFTKSPFKAAIIGELLLFNNADPNIFNKDNWCPIHIAAKKGQKEAIKWIIRENPLLKLNSLKMFDLNIQGGTDHWTPLHLAGAAGHSAIIFNLIEAGADLFSRNLDGRTPRMGSKGNLALSKIFKRAEDIGMCSILGGRTVQELGDNGTPDLNTFITKLSNQELVTASISGMGMGMGMGNRDIRDNRDNNPNRTNKPNKPTNRPTNKNTSILLPEFSILSEVIRVALESKKRCVVQRIYGDIFTRMNEFKKVQFISMLFDGGGSRSRQPPPGVIPNKDLLDKSQQSGSIMETTIAKYPDPSNKQELDQVMERWQFIITNENRALHLRMEALNNILRYYEYINLGNYLGGKYIMEDIRIFLIDVIKCQAIEIRNMSFCIELIEVASSICGDRLIPPLMTLSTYDRCNSYLKTVIHEQLTNLRRRPREPASRVTRNLLQLGKTGKLEMSTKTGSNRNITGEIHQIHHHQIADSGAVYEPLSTKAVGAGAPPTFFPPRRETSKFEGRQVGTYNNLEQNSFTHEINTTTNKVGASRYFESPVGQSRTHKRNLNKTYGGGVLDQRGYAMGFNFKNKAVPKQSNL